MTNNPGVLKEKTVMHLNAGNRIKHSSFFFVSFEQMVLRPLGGTGKVSLDGGRETHNGPEWVS